MRASSFMLSTNRVFASSALRPESSSSFSRSCCCIFSRSSALIWRSFFSLSIRCCCCSTSCLRRAMSSCLWLRLISLCLSLFSLCWIFWFLDWISFSSSAFLFRNFSFTSSIFFSFKTSASFCAVSINSLYFPFIM